MFMVKIKKVSLLYFEVFMEFENYGLTNLGLLVLFESVNRLMFLKNKNYFFEF